MPAQVVSVRDSECEVTHSHGVRWTIASNRRDNGPTDDKNGSRRYQVMLKSMKLMPDASVSKATFNGYFSDVKGKRKATDDPDESQPSKRVNDEDDDDDEDQQAEGSASHMHNGYAMQVTDG